MIEVARSPLPSPPSALARLPAGPAALITGFTVVRGEAFLQSAMQRMTRRSCTVALVLSDRKRPTSQNVVGVITRQEIAVAVMSDIAQ